MTDATGADVSPVADLSHYPDSRQEFTSADSTADAVHPPGCSPWVGDWSFGVAEPMAELNSASDEAEPFVSWDGLTVYFASDRPGGVGSYDVYRGTRAARELPWSSIENYATINTTANEGSFVLSADGLTAYLASSRPGGKGRSDLWVGKRSNTAELFSSNSFSPLTELNTPYDEWDPYPSSDGLRLYYVSDRFLAADSNNDLVVAVRSSPDAPFLAPLALALNLPGSVSEANLALSADELTIVYSTGRGGGAADIWYAVRGDRSAAFSLPQPVPGVNTSAREAQLYLSPDGCELYFARTAAASGADLFRARVQR